MIVCWFTPLWFSCRPSVIIIIISCCLQESRKLLADRDEEITHLKSELEQYKIQVAREIAHKTKIAKSLDESLKQVREMEEITLQWQLEVGVVNE